MLGETVAFISVFLGGVETANIGPYDFFGAEQMKRVIWSDIERSYVNTHPDGFIDVDGKIYMLDDWEVKIESCYSSVCSEIIKERVSAIKERKAEQIKIMHNVP